MAFDPDTYLASKKTNDEFDPDSYLASKAPVGEVPEEETVEFEGEPSSLSQKWSEGVDVPAVVQKGAQVLETGIRAGRAAGVAVGQATDGMGAPQNPTNVVMPLGMEQLTGMAARVPGAIKRGMEAFSPDFQPTEGRESTFADLGEMGASMVITYPILGLGARNPSVTGGLTFGAMEAIKQAAREGRIVPREVAKEAAVAAALPQVVPAVQAVSNATKNLLKGVLTKTAKVPEKAIDIALDNPALLNEFSGANNAIRDKVISLQKTISDSRQNAGKVLSKVRKNLGIDRPIEAPIEDELVKNPKVLDMEFNKLPELLGKISDPRTKLALIDDLRINIKSALTPPKPGSTLPPISDRVSAQLNDRLSKLNTMIEGIEGGKRLRLAERGFASTAKVYDELQTAMATPGKAEQVLERLFKGENLDDVIGSKKTMIDLLTKLERKEGVKLVGPIMSEFSSRAFSSIEPKGFSGSVLAGVAAALALLNQPALAAGAAVASSPRGAIEIVKRGKQVSGAMKLAAKTVASPMGRAAISSQRLFSGTEEE